MACSPRPPDGTQFYGYGGDFGEVVHDGNFVMDGMVLPDDRRRPGWPSSRPSASR